MSETNLLLGAVLSPRTVRVLAGTIFASALAMPWLTWWGGAFGVADEIVLPEVFVEYRPALVALPGGRFMMGSTAAEQAQARAEAMKAGLAWTVAADAFSDETQHEMEVGPFEICQTEVTQGQWKAVMGVEALARSECGDEVCDDDKPITDVTWFEAVEYMNRLSDREHLSRCYVMVGERDIYWYPECTGYRLPTEAEWEYAARAGSVTTYGFGDEPRRLCEYGNVADQASWKKYPGGSVADCDDGAADLAAVGSYKPNAWGIHDMHGNAVEWVWDWYGDYPENPERDYAGPEKGLARMLRGGSFRGEPRFVRSASRISKGSAEDSMWSMGIRCARPLPIRDP